MRARSLVLAAAAVLCACSPGPSPSGPRSIFLIVVDTLRADALSCYDPRAAPTPNIDALAKEGVRFRHAQAVASWTLPSMAALLTSRLPRELGMLERSDDLRWPERRREQRRMVTMELVPGARSVAELLREAGYATAAFVNQPILAPRRGFDRGFATWVQAVGKGNLQDRDELAPGNRQTWGSARHAYRNDGLVVDAFAEWLSSQPPDRPVFAWVHLLTPHRPYVPQDATGLPPHAVADPGSRERYQAEVRDVDLLVGSALRAIEAHRDRESRVVAFASDHGEAFGEHGFYEHGNTLHGEVLQVPLILSAPGALPAGAVVESVVGMLDVAPTLLDLVSLPALTGMRGQSLLPVIAGRESHREVVAEGMLYGASERVYIRDGWKLLVDEAGGSALYFLEDDPEERHDLHARQPDRHQALRARLDEVLRQPVGMPGPPAPAQDPDEETREALRALGYVDEE